MITLEFNRKDLDRIRKALERIADIRKRNSALYRAFIRVVLVLERGLKKNVSGKYLKVRSGRLRSSIGSKVKIEGDKLVGYIGSGVRSGKRVKYANILETGGVIKPKRAKMLAIPLKPALTKAGVPKKPSPRDWVGAFFLKAKNGKKYIAIHNRSGGIDLLYVLKDKVTIPAKMYMSKTVSDYQGKAFNVFKGELMRAIRRYA